MIKLIAFFLLTFNVSFGQSTAEKIMISAKTNFKGDSINNSVNKKFNNRISLRQINSSHSKIDIRIYKLSTLSNTKSLRRIFLADNTWKAKEYDEWNHPQSIKRYKLSASQSLDSLILKLLANNILTLPTQDSLKSRMKKFAGKVNEGYPVYSGMRVNDGNVYYIEIKIGDTFRVYEFENPEKYSKYYHNIVEFKEYVNVVRVFDSFSNEIIPPNSEKYKQIIY